MAHRGRKEQKEQPAHKGRKALLELKGRLAQEDRSGIQAQKSRVPVPLVQFFQDQDNVSAGQ